jgi:hypothetical protein
MITRKAVIFLLLLVPASTTGCILIVVPVPRSVKEEGARATVGLEQLDFLEEGETHRRDVLLRLGEPDETHRIGANCYDSYLCDVSRTDTFVAIGIIAPTGGAGDAKIHRETRRDFLFIKFDEGGVARNHTFETLRLTRNKTGDVSGKSVSEMIQDWESGKGTPPPSTPRKR